ncbi:serine/threonine-protein kinase [Streptomyces sp. NPDC052164]|uniref:WD40 repeat domain-containing serine/threonine protein kinase n=1 Tax=Streptomyces sp. NPDC052164 TaxID=3155529 RepID=UPI00342EBDC4
MDALKPDDPRWVGPYRLEGRLGEGGMGSVYLGTSPGGRKVAVKLIKRELASTPEFRQRFAREVEAARRVGGFHTAQVVDADPDAESPWLVTAFIAGPNLHEVVDTDGPLAPDAVLRLGAGLSEGLAAIHACGLVHRDLKPGNVILAEDGPRIIDFGIARAVDASSLTATGTIIGTYAYMSPEQIRADRAGAASDVFSLGSVLAFAATGRGPFDSPTLIEVVQRILDEQPALDGVDGTLRGLLAECLAKDPAARPSVAALPKRFAGGPVPGAPADPRIPGPPSTPPPAAPERTIALVPRPQQRPYVPTAPGDSPVPPGYGPPAAASTTTRRGPSRRTLLFGGAGATAAAIVGTVALLRGRGDADGTDQGAEGADDSASSKPSSSDSASPSPPEPSQQYVPLKGLDTTRAIAFSTDGKSLCATGSNTVCRWDLTTRKVTPTYIGSPGFLQPTLISRDLTYVVRAEENKIRIWSTATGRALHTFSVPKSKTEGEEGWPTGVAIAHDNNTVAATASTGLYLWDLSSGTSLGTREDTAGGPVAFRNDGKMLAAGQPLRTLNPAGTPMSTVKDSEAAQFAAFSPGGQILAYGDMNGTIQVWNTDSGQPVVQLDGVEGLLHTLAFHPGGRLLAAGDQAGKAHVWDTVTGRKTATFACPNSVEAVAFSPDGKTLATGLMSAVTDTDKDAVLLWRLP